MELQADVHQWFLNFRAHFSLHDKTITPHWLTLCGRSETGKTHCADQVWARALGLTRTHQGCEFSPEKIWWPGYVNKLRTGKWYDHQADTANWPLLYLDEVGACRDTTGYVAEQLYVTLGQRERKWTILTTNLTMDQLGVIDERIVSRCVRNGGIVVEVNTVPFTSRQV